MTPLAVAQQTVAVAAAILHNTGDPMRVPFACVEEDLQFAGMDCPEDQPCPVYLELSGIAAVGDRIAISGDLHSGAATISSVLLMSTDRGLSWKEPFARVRGAALDQVQFIDAAHGWVAGETQYPLSRDPFFVITIDGGASWRQQPVSGEESPGAIQSFSFDSPQHGELVVDAGAASPGGRYVAYETHTGGENWDMRGVSNQPPKVKSVAAGGDWRIRAGRDGAVWEIEQRSGDKWSSPAAFLVDTANCTIKPGELKAPATLDSAPDSAAPDPK